MERAEHVQGRHDNYLWHLVKTNVLLWYVCYHFHYFVSRLRVNRERQDNFHVLIKHFM